ncbi:MAG: hypothetical protein PHO76_12975 [Methylotenera sp.]|nr:hypothetical protein [Methylotenera sp.]MDD4926157.1 hypothetical protein [Methylotenera sp.]
MTLTKAIKIEIDNLTAIQVALDVANGKSTSHTLHNANLILKMVEIQEESASDLLGKSNLSGVRYIYQSGLEVTKSYDHKRRGTQLTLVRKSKNWFLTNVQSIDLYQQAGKSQLMLTENQVQIAIKKFVKSAGFGVQSSEVNN